MAKIKRARSMLTLTAQPRWCGDGADGQSAASASQSSADRGSIAPAAGAATSSSALSTSVRAATTTTAAVCPSQRLLLSPAAVDDIVWAPYRGELFHAVVTRVFGTSNTAKVSFKFVEDLVLGRRADVFHCLQRDLRKFEYGESMKSLAASHKVPCDLELSQEAAETYFALANGRRPLDFLSTGCGHIKRMRYGFDIQEIDDLNPIKNETSAPDVPSRKRRLIPKCMFVRTKTNTSSRSTDDGNEDTDDEGIVDSTPPPVAAEAVSERSETDKAKLKRQARFSHRLLAVIKSAGCAQHLLTIHAGEVDSWRRREFQGGHLQRLIFSSGVGDMVADGSVTRQAIRALEQLFDGVSSVPTIHRDRYLWDVMLPEAIKYAVAKLSSKTLSDQELERCVLLGSPRFRASRRRQGK